jgi:major membrane immunogen (membrane-anchored lipoprotein)
MMMLLIGVGSATAAMPEGSYKKSCRSCSDDGKTLSCECKMKNGNYKETKLVFDYCKKNSISNDNGNLKCVGDLNLLERNRKINQHSTPIPASTLKKVTEANKKQKTD